MGPELIAFLLAGGGLAALSVLMDNDDDSSASDETDGEDTTGGGEGTDWTETLVQGTSGDDHLSMIDADAPEIGADENLVYDGGAGNDTISMGRTASSGASEDDLGRAEALGGDGDDVISFQGMDAVQQFGDGGAGNDVLSNENSVNATTTLLGGAGDDMISGSAGSLDGGAGNDTLIATPLLPFGNPQFDDNSGIVTLTGGEGSDVFEASAITDWQDSSDVLMPDVLITDFETGTDQLHLYPFLVANNQLFDGFEDVNWASATHVLKDISIVEDANGTIVTANYEGDTDFVHTITLAGVTGLSRDDIVLDEWGWTRNPDDVAALLPDEGATDAGGRDVYVWGDDDAESWELTDVHNIRGHLGGGDDTLSVIAAPDPDPSTFDRIHGGDGNDLIEFDFSARTLVEAETLIRSHILGGAGNDTLTGIATTHDIYGGEGDDVIDVSATSPTNPFEHVAHARVDPGEGNDSVTVSGNMDVFLGDYDDADHLTIVDGPDDGLIRAYDVTDADTVTIVVPADMLDQVVVDSQPFGGTSAGYNVSVSYGNGDFAYLAIEGDLTRPVFDPDNPDALIRVVGQ